jgi:HK97 family phage major capsid protein
MTLIEQREELLNEYERYLDNSKGNFSVTRNNEFKARIEAIDLKIREARNSEVAGNREYRAAVPTTSNIFGSHRSQTAEAQEKELRAYDLFLRRGHAAVEADSELRTYAPLNSTEETMGQYLVPVTTGPEIEKKMKSVGAILSILRDVSTTDGSLINWPTSDDTAENGEFIDENGAVGQANPVFGVVPVSAFQWSSKQVVVPLRLIQDSKFDLVGHLTECFGMRAGRGFSDRVVNDETDGLLNISGTGSLESASSTVLNYFEPLTLQGKIDLSYNLNGTYVMNQATYLGYRALVATTGQPLWPEADYKAGLFHGKPFILCQDMPSFGTAGHQYLAYGDFSKYLMRRVGQMSVFRFSELYMANLQQAFQAYQRVAFKCVQPAAISILKAKSS